MPENLKPKLKITLIILGLIFLPPIGLYFALRKTNWTKRTKIITSVVAVLWTAFIIYAIIAAPPTISMSSIKESGNAPTKSGTVLLKGEISPDNAALTVDGTTVKVEDDGTYEYKAPLKEGDNTVQVVIKDGDKVTKKTYKVHRYTKKEIAKQKADEAKRKKQQADKKRLKEQQDAAKKAKDKATATKKAADATAKKAKDKAAADKKAADAAAKATANAQRKAAEEAARNQPKTSFGDGTFLVNKDIAPGTYRTSNATGYCYYERLSGTSGTFDDIIANGNPDGQAIITIAPSDVAFKSARCGSWVKI